VRDDLPDLLWPALYMTHKDRTHAAVDFVRWQEDVLTELDLLKQPPTGHRFVAACLSGRLTGLDRLAEQVPEARDIVIRAAHDRGLLPEPVASALSTYPHRPAAWLTQREPTSPELEDLKLISDALREAIGDGHREAVLKCISIWAGVHRATFGTDAETIELLQPYPFQKATRSKADTVVRASWGASQGADLVRDPKKYDASLAWARTFWDFNSMTSGCIRKRELEARRAHADQSSDDTARSR
jgi:hypothetical protein